MNDFLPNAILKDNKAQGVKKALANKRGDVYFEYLICLFLFLAALSLTIQVLSAVRLKLWLDGRTSAAVRSVQINGEITDGAEAVIEEIKNRLGSDITVEWDTHFIAGTRKVQLGDMIRLRVSANTTLFKIGAEEVRISISSEAVGTSEVYWKDS